jgi:hypothetical protein
MFLSRPLESGVGRTVLMRYRFERQLTVPVKSLVVGLPNYGAPFRAVVGLTLGALPSLSERRRVACRAAA